MEELTKEFNRKIQSIKFSLDKNDEVIASQNTEAISRHETLLMSKLQAAHTVKESIMELKFANEESHEQVTTWAKKHETFLKEANERDLVIRHQVAIKGCLINPLGESRISDGRPGRSTRYLLCHNDWYWSRLIN